MTGTARDDREALGLVGIARRAGRAVIGANAIRSAANARGVCAVVAARDASGNALARLGEGAGEAPVVRIGTKEELGRAVGRGVAALVGVTDSALAAKIVALGGSGEAGVEQAMNDTRDNPGRLDP